MDIYTNIYESDVIHISLHVMTFLLLVQYPIKLILSRLDTFNCALYSSYGTSE